ncbi:hypothetical protein V8E54_010034 [Elaphomyces granulatus]
MAASGLTCVYYKGHFAATLTGFSGNQEILGRIPNLIFRPLVGVVGLTPSISTEIRLTYYSDVKSASEKPPPQELAIHGEGIQARFGGGNEREGYENESSDDEVEINEEEVNRFLEEGTAGIGNTDDAIEAGK